MKRKRHSPVAEGFSEGVGACCAVRRTLRCDGPWWFCRIVRVSQRRACRLTSQHLNTQRRPVQLADIEEQKLKRRIRELARRHVRWGINHKWVQRIWREEGLQRPLPRKRKRSRTAGGSRELLRSEYPHHVLAIDFQFDQTMDGRTLKFLNVIDEFSRVCLAIRVGRRCKAVDVIDTIEELLKLYPAPAHLRMDNGPEFIAHALQEWFIGNGSATGYIPPGSPWENPFVESFNCRFRDEFLNIELFASLQEAKLLAKQHRIEYNVYRPHFALIRTGAAKGITSPNHDS
jgi:putative transposase